MTSPKKNYRRNMPCPCGSGKRFKHCHGRLSEESARTGADIPHEIKQKLAEAQAKERAFKTAHGKSKPIISTEFKDWRFVAVGSELHYAQKSKSNYFTDFLAFVYFSILGIPVLLSGIKKLSN